MNSPHSLQVSTFILTKCKMELIRHYFHTIIVTVSTGPPQGITPSVTARSVSVSWNEIECIERNGMITNYTVEFSSLGASVLPGVLKKEIHSQWIHSFH